jgi:hypothetical protein
MERRPSLSESQINISAQLAQRLYSKFSDTGQIIPNRTKKVKKLRPIRNPKDALPEISNGTFGEKPEFPTMHFPKGFERFSGLDNQFLTQTISPAKFGHNRLPSLSKVASHHNLSNTKSDSRLLQTISPSKLGGGTLLKYPANMPKNVLHYDDKLESIRNLGLGDGVKSLALLKKEQDQARKKFLDAPRRSVTQLQPLERNLQKREPVDEEKLVVFNKEFGGSLSSKDLVKKMDDKDFLTPLDFIACCDRDPEFANRFCY